jgi:hypothetical protein
MENYFTNLFNMLGGQPQVDPATLAPQARQQVIDQALRQQQQLETAPIGFFNYLSGQGRQVPEVDVAALPYGTGATAQTGVQSIDAAMAQQRMVENINKEILDPLKPKAGMFDALSDMSGQETMALISGIQGLLAEPEAPQLANLRIPSATAGLRLGETDLSKYYQGLLR